MLAKQKNSFLVFGKAASVLKSVFLAICVGVFVSQAYLVFELYMKNVTVSGITYDEPPQHVYPSVTVCPNEILKQKSFPITEQQFDEVSFKVVGY
jgi:hypothetical protein